MKALARPAAAVFFSCFVSTLAHPASGEKSSIPPRPGSR